MLTKSCLSFVLETARLWQAFEGKWSVGWGGGGDSVREGKGKEVPRVFPVPLPLQTAVTQAMKKPTCRPQVGNRLFTGILASIFLDSLSFVLACSGRSDNRERTKMGREENVPRATPYYLNAWNRLPSAFLCIPFLFFPSARSVPVVTRAFSLLFVSTTSKQGIKCELFTYSPQGLYDIHVKLQGVPLLGWEAPVMAVGMNAR